MGWKSRPPSNRPGTPGQGRRHGTTRVAGDTFGVGGCASVRAMAVDPQLLEILVCPKSRGRLELVELPAAIRQALVDRYREHFRDEVPVVESGLLCAESQLVYPIVSDIPVLLVDEALPASILAG